jgi:hypothetical protein
VVVWRAGRRSLRVMDEGSNPGSAAQYPPFIPPGELAILSPKVWSKTQATEYATWLFAISQARIRAMLAYFGRSQTWDNSTIAELDQVLATALPHPPFSEEGPRGRELTGQGYGVAADMGLLLADLLLRHPGVSWEIVRRPRSDVSFNRPVLVGFANNLPIDPIWASSGPAIRMARGEPTKGGWNRILDYALELIYTAQVTLPDAG